MLYQLYLNKAGGGGAKQFRKLFWQKKTKPQVNGYTTSQNNHIFGFHIQQVFPFPSLPFSYWLAKQIFRKTFEINILKKMLI